MDLKIVPKPGNKHLVYLVDEAAQLDGIDLLSPQEKEYLTRALQEDQSSVSINQYGRFVLIQKVTPKKTPDQSRESIRRAGALAQQTAERNKWKELTIGSLSKDEQAIYHFAEGLILSSYQFLKYRSDADKIRHGLTKISFLRTAITQKMVDQLECVTDGIFRMRDLINEPLNSLGAEQLAKEISAMGKQAGFTVNVLRKAQIEKEKMGGILAVNRGSIDPPTFSIMEFKPKKAVNKNPIVLVGKGIVYDTGGLSLKPTPASMDRMKSDMSGAALVSCAMYIVSKLQLPLHVIALVPATDNRPGENAYVPGDIITMYSGASVEVLNTDAEGRLVLADALHWAKRYNPELVMDFATLTGAASAAVGDQGIVCMGTADEPVKNALRDSGYRTHERLVEFPLWEEYGELIKSDFADMKNVGGPTGGAITAGKFLEHYTGYPWMHFDIAGVSFSVAKKTYMPAGGTGFGLRLIVDFLMSYAQAGAIQKNN